MTLLAKILDISFFLQVEICTYLQTQMKTIMLHLNRQFSTNWDFVVSKYHQGFTLLQNSKYVINILDKKPNEHHLSVSVSNFGLVIFSVFYWLYVADQHRGDPASKDRAPLKEPKTGPWVTHHTTPL